jgi:hypothetical protein
MRRRAYPTSSGVSGCLRNIYELNLDRNLVVVVGFAKLVAEGNGSTTQKGVTLSKFSDITHIHVDTWCFGIAAFVSWFGQYLLNTFQVQVTAPANQQQALDEATRKLVLIMSLAIIYGLVVHVPLWCTSAETLGSRQSRQWDLIWRWSSCVTAAILPLIAIAVLGTCDRASQGVQRAVWAVWNVFGFNLGWRVTEILPISGITNSKQDGGW